VEDEAWLVREEMGLPGRSLQEESELEDDGAINKGLERERHGGIE
jgi:hypothetical protein